MEIILKKDVTGLGYTHDVLTVKDGYARNFLIPKGHAVLATESNRKINAEDLRQKSFKAQKTKNEAEIVAKSLENITVKIGAKAAETGKIYGSVNSIQIADDIDRKKIHVDGESIKETGNYTANIRLHKDLLVTINFEVIAE
jgi:large subunit ribosomal protein L9